jgi:hypothetical protein
MLKMDIIISSPTRRASARGMFNRAALVDGYGYFSNNRDVAQA